GKKVRTNMYNFEFFVRRLYGCPRIVSTKIQPSTRTIVPGCHGISALAARRGRVSEQGEYPRRDRQAIHPSGRALLRSGCVSDFPPGPKQEPRWSGCASL